MPAILSALIEHCSRYRILIVLAALAVTGTGCKLKVHVPTSAGHVESISGAYYCSIYHICEFNLTGTPFDETFRAVPKQGYVFAGWKDRPQGLYGNSIENARIITNGESDAVASDIVYYLEPRFIKTDELEWKPKGDDLLGTKSNPVENVELSADGDVYAMIDESATGISASVYEWAGSRWRMRGDAIGQAVDGAVVDIALSRDGTVLAYSSQTSDRANEVRVFKWTGTEWESLGEKIRGEYPGDHSGTLALNGNGTVLAIGAPANPDGGGADAGHARVFSWKSENWEQLGEDIDGMAESMLGSAVDLSANGRVLAVGAPAKAGSDSSPVGHVAMYAWNGSSWQLRGEKIQGYNAEAGFGLSLSLSASGNHVAMCSTDLYARVFVWDGEQWIGRGRKLESNMPNIQVTNIDISDSGGIVAISEPEYGLQRPWSGEGRIRVLIWDGKKWVRLGKLMFGDTDCDKYGNCIEGEARGARLNADGSVLALVDSGTGKRLLRGGRVRVFSGKD